MSTITIRLVESLEDVEHFRVLEHLIWETPPNASIPAHVIVTTIHNGGGLLAAFAADGPPETGGMVGITYWWPGLGTPTTGPAPGGEPGGALRLKMCSHMAGVLPPWRSRGLGLRLKLAQRDVILQQGATDWVTWTYDPLIRTNAAFNLHRLGAVCNTYHVNRYGMMSDGINAGTPSDRCQVDWWLESARVTARAHDSTPGGARERTLPLTAHDGVLTARRLPQGLLAPPDELPSLASPSLALPLPDDIYAIRAADHELGIAWRLWQRAALSAAFAAGYLLTDCAICADSQWRYLLTCAAP
jgi:predicted GNAT superfamily acetyltransferase